MEKTNWLKSFINAFRNTNNGDEGIELTKKEKEELAELEKIQQQVHEKHNFVEHAEVSEEVAKKRASGRPKKNAKTLGTK